MHIDPHRTALVTLDVQQGVVSVYVKDEQYLARAASAIAAARAAGVTVVHVKVAFRPGVPEASPRNMFLSAVKASPPHQRFFQEPGGAIHPALGLDPGDLIVTKHRISAFAGTDLDLLLRAHDVTTIVAFGIATSGAVLSTVLEAADSDYRVLVVRDLCADLDAELHAVVLDKLLPRQAIVISSDVLGAALAAA